MRPRRAIGPLGFLSLTAVFAAALVIGYVAVDQVRKGVRETRLDYLERLVLVGADALAALGHWPNVEEAQSLLRIWEGDTGLRFTLLDSKGWAVADSRFSAAYVGNLAHLYEVDAALRATKVPFVARRVDQEHAVLCAAAPIFVAGETIGVLRVTSSAALEGIPSALPVWIALGLTFSVWAISALHARSCSKGLQEEISELQETVRAFSQGKLDHRVPPPELNELEPLVDALNAMAHEMDHRHARLLEYATQRDAVLASMTEGVIAVDIEERVMTANRAAVRMLGLPEVEVRGLPIQGVLRHPEFDRVMQEVKKTDAPAQGEILLWEPEDRTLFVTATPLKDSSGYRIGILVVLKDVTQLKRLERVRRDFVANVSHELRTPVSTIRGAIETLLSGAAEDPAARERFLGMINRSASRLSAIIEDLLTLARLEEGGAEREPGLSYQPLLPCIEEALLDVSPLAEERGVGLRLLCPNDLCARIRPALISQAVVNLVDNAIRHSPRGETVEIEVEKKDGEVEIRVRDRGPGIEERHVSRIFERFYRVDPGRSRQEGGTGLGLAIVKHIAQAHRGSVEVWTARGRGSTFILRIPVGGPDEE